MRLDDVLRVLERVRGFWVRDLWRVERQAGTAWPVRVGVFVARSLYILVAGFARPQIRLRAGSLTYVSLLSLVPALAVAFSLFAAFGGLRNVESHAKNFLVQALAVGHRETILAYLDDFVGQTSAAKLGTVGTVFLFVTVLSLLSQIEQAFNDIWGVRKSRNILQRFQRYWPLVTLGPIVFGLSLSASAALQSSRFAEGIALYVPAVGWLLGIGPLVLICVFFALLYLIMPNTKVSVQGALVGGLVAGVLWTGAQKLFAVYAANAITFSTIYGSLGAVPLFVIWIYVSWMVALLGASLTYAIQSVRTYEPERFVSQAEREYVAVRLMAAVAEHFAAGQGALFAQTLLDQVSVPPRLARVVLRRLVRCGLLHETVGDDPGFVPARPIEQISLASIVDRMRHGEAGGAARSTGRPRCDEDPLSRVTARYLEAARGSLYTEIGRVMLTDVVKEASEPRAVA